jgi:Winged helix DNA-binding domain
VRSLSWRQVLARRLARQHLVVPAPRREIVRVVADVCGVHAQVMASAGISLGIRVDGVTRRDVEDELWTHRRLVKAYGPRGTIHVLASDELPLWSAALDADLRAAAAPQRAARLDRLGIEQSQLDDMVAAIGDALAGRRLTLEQLGDEVVRRVGAWAGAEILPAFGGTWPLWRTAVEPAASAGVLCFGPNERRRTTFVRPEDWLGRPPRTVDPREAVREILRRFLRTYGPATAAEFAQWLHVAGTMATDALKSIADEVEEVDVEGDRRWILAADADVPPAPRRETVWLLPTFDAYVVGSFPRDRLVSDRAADRVSGTLPRWRGGRQALTGSLPVLAIGGIVAGIWERRATARQLSIRVEPLSGLSDRRRRGVEASAARIGEILERDVDLSIGAIEARPHL